MGCDPFSGHAGTTQSTIILNQVVNTIFVIGFSHFTLQSPFLDCLEKALLRLVVYLFCVKHSLFFCSLPYRFKSENVSSPCNVSYLTLADRPLKRFSSLWIMSMSIRTTGFQSDDTEKT